MPRAPNVALGTSFGPEPRYGFCTYVPTRAPHRVLPIPSA